MDAYEYHLILEIQQVVRDELSSERRAAARDAHMMSETKPARGKRG